MGILPGWKIAVVLNITIDSAKLGFENGEIGFIENKDIGWGHAWRQNQKIGRRLKQLKDFVSEGSVVLVEVVDKQIVVKWSSDEARAMAGTMRALISNCVIGVTQGYVKNIKLNGVGYRAKVEGKKITLTLGFSHPVIYELPPEVDAKSEGQTEFNLTSINKQILGQVSSEIRAFRPPEPYKGKGVFVDNEHVIRKERKKAATA